MGKHRRGSNSESGMRLLRRLEKNHDGIRSATTRQPYIQLYQAIKYLSLDIARIDTMLVRWFPQWAAVGKLLFHTHSIYHHGGESP